MAKFREQFFAEYTPYLKSAHWRAKRAAVFAWKGQICTAQMDGCNGAATDCHHTKDGYKLAFDTPLFELEPVCKSCHRKITNAHRTAKHKRGDLTEVWNRILSKEI